MLLWQCTDAAANSDTTADELAAQIRATDEQLAILRKKIDQNTLLKEEVQAAFNAAREKRSEREQRLTELDNRIKQFNAQLQELEVSVSDARDNMQLHKQKLAEALASAQQFRTESALQVLLHHDDPAHAQRIAVLREYVIDAQKRQVQTAIRFLADVEQAQLSALKDRNWLNHIRDKATRQRDNFLQVAQAKRLQIDDIDIQLQQSSRSVKQLQADQQRLQSLIDELEARQRSGSGYFAALQGHIEWPVSGDIKASFGDTKSLGKMHWEGLFIAASSGNAVTAVADGEVVYSDVLEGYGILVILDHGDGYMTLYGGNQSVSVSDGSWVESGSTIASVGDWRSEHQRSVF
jgi:septal ring factor EnvC (AmiA/AmiB activator)